ncbi:MAG: low molecular weight phosphotyrosine protein phosphatase [Xanthomonadales bacterium]|nr:low molecular weight phosphotyrosine protein phosphatase [Xanthomonadales bacterium]
MSRSVLFVCLGNICRSPMAAAVAHYEFAHAGLDWQVASAGTGNWHVGQCADPRAADCAGAAGFALDQHRGRQVQIDDFHRFDWILAMDQANLRELKALAPANASAQLGLLLQVAGTAPPDEVPDPYFGGRDGFDAVLSLLREAIARLPQRL